MAEAEEPAISAMRAPGTRRQDGDRQRGIRFVWVVVIYVVASVVYVSPVFAPDMAYGPSDILLSGAPYREALAAEPTLGNSLQNDQVEQLPFVIKFWTELRRGEVRLWEPNVGGGSPLLLAVHNRILAPWNAAFLVVPARYAGAVATALAFFVAQMGTYALARRIGISRRGALLAGVVYGFSGPVTSFVFRINEVFLAPALLASIHLGVRGGQPRRWGWLATFACTAFVLLSGFPAMAAVTVYLAVAWMLYLAGADGFATAHRWGTRLVASAGRAVPVGLSMVAGLAAASGVLLPTYRFLAESGALERAYDVGGSAGLESLATAVSGRIHGTFQAGSRWAGQDVIANTFQGSLTVGLVALVLVGAGAWFARRGDAGCRAAGRDLGWFFAPVALFVLLAVYLGGVALGLVHLLPFMDSNDFQRARFIVVLGVALLAGAGLEAWLRGPEKPGTTRPHAVSLQVCSIGLLAVIALATYQTLTVAILRDALPTVMLSLVVPALCLVAALAAVRYLRSARPATLAVLVVVGVSMVELQWGAWGFTPVSPQSTFYPSPPLPAHVEADLAIGGGSRFLALGRPAVRPNSAVVMGLRDARIAWPAYEPYRQVLEAAEPQVFERFRLKTDFTVDLDIMGAALDRAAVGYVMTQPGERVFGTTGTTADVIAAADQPSVRDFAVDRNPPHPVRAIDVPLETDGSCEGQGRIHLARDGDRIGQRQARDIVEDGRTRFVVPDVRFGPDTVFTVAGGEGCGVSVVEDRVGLQMVDPDVPLTLEYVGDWIVYGRPQALPRVQLTSDAEVVPDPVASVEHLRQPSSGPVSVDADPGALDVTTGSVDLRVDASDRVEIDVEADGRGLLVLRDVDAPGWTAAVDGEAAEILTVDHAFRGVVVPSGASTVKFVYRPTEFVIGVAAGGPLAVVLMGGLFVWGGDRRRGWGRPVVGPPGDGSRSGA